MKKEEALKKIITLVNDNFIDTLLVGVEEHKEDFPFTIAVANFIGELREKNIIVELYNTFEDSIIDRIHRETSNYLAK